MSDNNVFTLRNDNAGKKQPYRIEVVCKVTHHAYYEYDPQETYLAQAHYRDGKIQNIFSGDSWTSVVEFVALLMRERWRVTMLCGMPVEDSYLVRAGVDTPGLASFLRMKEQKM